MPGKGSKRASVLSSGPLGGSAALSCWRIAERWMGSRSSRAPGVCSATAPASQTRPRPIAANQHARRRGRRARPGPGPAARAGGSRAPRARRPGCPRPAGRPSGRTAARRESASPRTGASGPIREPRKPPATKPASESAPTMSPCAYPHTAMASAKATMIQSTQVTRRRNLAAHRVTLGLRARALESTHPDRSSRRALPPPDPPDHPHRGAGAGLARRRPDRGRLGRLLHQAHRAASTPRPGSAAT